MAKIGSRQQLSGKEQAITYRVCSLLLGTPTMNATQVAERVNDEFGEEILTREQVYPRIVKGVEQNLVRFVPPRNSTLKGSVASTYNLSGDAIQVIDVESKGEDEGSLQWAGDQVAAAGAEYVFELIDDVWNSKPTNDRSNDYVRIGLGPGRATLSFCRHLSLLLRSSANSPPIQLIAISAGCAANHPEYASTSFFGLFPRGDKCDFLGLFAETLVPAHELSEIFTRPGIKEAHAIRNRIDIVVTSLGVQEDEHDLLRHFLTDAGCPLPKDCVGNLQYRPYTKTEPFLEKDNNLRAVTLFEIKDFVEMAQKKNRHVVLLARQCAACGMSRAAALYPLMKTECLRAWSHIVMDVKTAQELLERADRTGK